MSGKTVDDCSDFPENSDFSEESHKPQSLTDRYRLKDSRSCRAGSPDLDLLPSPKGSRTGRTTSRNTFILRWLRVFLIPATPVCSSRATPLAADRAADRAAGGRGRSLGAFAGSLHRTPAADLCPQFPHAASDSGSPGPSRIDYRGKHFPDRIAAAVQPGTPRGL